MAQRKRNLQAVDPVKAFSLPDVAMLPEHQFILDGLAQGVMAARGQLQQAEQRFTAYVIECAQKLGVNTPQYMFEPEKRIFTKNPNFEPEKKEA